MRRTSTRPRDSNAGSQTVTEHESDHQQADTPQAGPGGVLKLRGLSTKKSPRVKWDEEVVDNEGLGRKKSKICCIYSKPRKWDDPFDVSSDESDDSCDEGAHDHKHHSHDDSAQASKSSESSSATQVVVPPPSNAYEKQPTYTGKGKGKAKAADL
ncbi:uncharacterized protein L969DRAFT_155975 [Mixia osmundae IAM 14324]|uniref:Type 1 phosphatases regulator n=1 Tax=Mixia osmundae (strain CBS 9802 / IAM 14324 / JCM 22182 / KY 12970) TaxID=764103 RepID=G7E336_MIXOS|nr:uncharacterized protein L969DRAFT_155975 [Mixia osmundae IAM 14324]KEI42494.1 hypothetical protein L969DRAFT_155975 [Mixia osmundae IAM 14324]GAA97217.1 hypothetical protein E5Q_03893 [Mixia osmundae IAM 14324]